MKSLSALFPKNLIAAIAAALAVAGATAAFADEPTVADSSAAEPSTIDVLAAEAQSIESSEIDSPAPVVTAVALLSRALDALPREKLGVTGTLTVRRQRGRVLAEKSFEMWLDYGAATPSATYEIKDSFGRVEDRLTLRRGEGDSAVIELVRGDPPEPAPVPALNARVGGTDLTWMDITLDFLWWKDATFEGEDSVKGRDCYVVVASPPEPIPGCIAVRLWLDKEVGFVMRAEQLDPQGEPSRRMWVQSVRQVKGRWIIGTMEIESLNGDHRTRLRMEDLLDP